MILLPQFVTNLTGQINIGNTPENKGQCVGLEAVWCDNLGLPHIWGNAIQLLDNADKSAYTVVMNTPTNAPSQGDIVVFKPNHTAIVVKADVNTLTVFEQNDHDANDPSGACQVKDYTYENVVGWLHPNNLPGTETVPVTPTVDQVQAQLKEEIKAVDQCQTQLQMANRTIVSQQGNIGTLVQDKETLQKQLDGVQSEYAKEQQEVSNLNDALQKLTNTNKNYNDDALNAKQKANEIGSYFDAIAKRCGIPFENVADDVIAESIIKTLDDKDARIKELQVRTFVKNAVSQSGPTLPSSTQKSIFWFLFGWMLKPSNI